MRKIVGATVGTPTSLERIKKDLLMVQPEEDGGDGISKEEKRLIMALFDGAAYTTDMSAKVEELKALWFERYKVHCNLTGVTANNGTAWVTENDTYTIEFTAEPGFTLEGAFVAVTMDSVPITNEVYKNGAITIPSVTGTVLITVRAKELPSHSVISNLNNVTVTNGADKVTAGEFFSADISWPDGYELNNIVITMGGVDVTEDVYGEGSILITQVTGDIVITAEAGIPVLYRLANTPVTANADLYEDTGLTFGASSANGVNGAWTVVATYTPTEMCDIAGIQNVEKGVTIGSTHSSEPLSPAVYCATGCFSPSWSNNAKATGVQTKIAVTHEAGATGKLSVYAVKDGVEYSGDAAATYSNLAASVYAGNLYVGGYSGATFKGTIEDFAIYGAVLSEAEIKAYLGVA